MNSDKERMREFGLESREENYAEVDFIKHILILNWSSQTNGLLYIVDDSVASIDNSVRNDFSDCSC